MMKSRLAVAVSVCLASVVLAGCPSLSTLQTARTVPRGKVRHAVGLEAVGVSVRGAGSAAAGQVEYGMRIGVSDNIDVGFKVYFLGLEGGAKFQLVRGPFDLSIAPAGAYTSVSVGEDSFHFLYLHLPILMGVHLGQFAEMGFGPKLLYALAFGSTSGGDFASVDGVTAGVYWNLLFKIGGFMLLGPEINAYTPLQENAFEGVVYQGGIVMAFGGMDEDPPPMAPPVPMQ